MYAACHLNVAVLAADVGGSCGCCVLLRKSPRGGVYAIILLVQLGAFLVFSLIATVPGVSGIAHVHVYFCSGPSLRLIVTEVTDKVRCIINLLIKMALF